MFTVKVKDGESEMLRVSEAADDSVVLRKSERDREELLLPECDIEPERDSVRGAERVP